MPFPSARLRTAWSASLPEVTAWRGSCAGPTLCTGSWVAAYETPPTAQKRAIRAIALAKLGRESWPFITRYIDRRGVGHEVGESRPPLGTPQLERSRWCFRNANH